MMVLIAGMAFGGLFRVETRAAPGGKPSNDAALLLFAQHCQKCHTGAKHKGDFQIESLSQDFSDRKNRELSLTVLEQLEAGKMPPKEKPQPPAREIQSVIKWIGERAGAAEIASRAAEGRVVLRRLNRAEYANTVRDLLGVEVDLTDLLPLDTSVSGFDNSAEALHTSSYLMRSYLDAADRVLNEAIANKLQPWLLKKRFDIREEKSVKPTGSVYGHVDDGGGDLRFVGVGQHPRHHVEFLQPRARQISLPYLGLRISERGQAGQLPRDGRHAQRSHRGAVH